MSATAMRFLQQENIRLNKEIEMLEQEKASLFKYLDLVQELYRASEEITTADNPAEIIDGLLHQIRLVVGANDGSISRLDANTSELEFVLVQGELGGQLAGFRINSTHGIAGWVVRNREPIIVNNPRQDWRFSQVVDEEFSFFTWSIASVPVIHNKKLVGVIELLNKHRSDFNAADISLLLLLGHAAGGVLDTLKPTQLPARHDANNDVPLA